MGAAYVPNEPYSHADSLIGESELAVRIPLSVAPPSFSNLQSNKQRSFPSQLRSNAARAGASGTGGMPSRRAAINALS